MLIVCLYTPSVYVLIAAHEICQKLKQRGTLAVVATRYRTPNKRKDQ